METLTAATFTHVVERHYSTSRGFRHGLAAAGKTHAVNVPNRVRLTEGERFTAVCGELAVIVYYSWTEEGRMNCERTDDAAKVTCKKCRKRLGL